MRVERTLRADRDIETILTETLRLFGERQLTLYADLIERAITMLAGDPLHVSSRERPEIDPRVRSLRLDSAGRPPHSASHLLFYLVHEKAGLAEPSEIVILRVLHERMSPRHRIAAALRDEITSRVKPAMRAGSPPSRC